MGRRDRIKQAQRQRWTQIILGIILIAVMVLSMSAVSFQNNAQTPQYNGVKFTPTTEGYEAKIAGREIIFYSYPIDGTPPQRTFQSGYGLLVEVIVSTNIEQQLKEASFLALTFDPNTTQPDIQFIELIRYDLATLASIPSGITYYHPSYTSVPVVPCNSSSQFPIIELVGTNETYGVLNVTNNGNCVTVTGDALAIPTFRDYLLQLRGGLFNG